MSLEVGLDSSVSIPCVTGMKRTFRNTTGKGAEWQLCSVDVVTGVEKMLAPVDLPTSTDAIAGLSLHPDGKRFLTSIAKLPYHVLMLEGFDQPPSRNWLDRLFRR